MSDKIFNPYPRINDEDFYEKIYIKKEFNKNKIERVKDDIDILCNPKEKLLLPQQKFLKNFISPNTPYNSILIYHGTGVGKTCAAISIAEGFRNVMRHYDNKILVILSQNLKENFKKELYDVDEESRKIHPDDRVQCTGDIYSSIVEKTNLTKVQKMKKVGSVIKMQYSFMGYRKFANNVKRLLNWNENKKFSNLSEEDINIIKKNFSNRLIIIDEVHNIKSDTTTELKEVPPVLNAVLKYGKNNKLVLMSATPMYNSPIEIIYIMNLLLLNDKCKTIKKSEIFDENNNITENGNKILGEISKGYISYLRGSKPIAFPFRIDSLDAIIPNVENDIYNKKIPNKIKYLKLVCDEMSKTQSEFYYNLLKIKTKKYTKLDDSNDEEEQEGARSFGALQSLTFAGNIIFPTSSENFVYGKEGFQKTDNGKGAFTYFEYKDKKSKYYSFSYQSHCLFNKDTDKEITFLDLSKIGNYSAKYEYIINKIINSKGIIFISSEYKDGGILPLALALEQNGIQRYTIEGENQLLNYKPNKKGYGGKSEPIDYYYGKKISNKLFKSKSSSGNKTKFNPAKYVLLTGDKNIQKIDINTVRRIVNDPDNKYGKNIKVILGTRVTSEGVDFKFIRQIHVLEPWYNLSKIEQIVGRGIRNCSHYILNEEERNVEVFLHAVKYNSSLKYKNLETIDLRNYRISENKDIKIKSVEDILIKYAVDCSLNKKGNIFNDYKIKKQITSTGAIIKVDPNDKPFSRECRYKSNCNYSCVWEPNPKKNYKIDVDTYNDTLAEDDINNTIKIIKKLFRKNTIYSSNDLLNKIKKTDNNITCDDYIFMAITNIINNKEKIYDKYGREGYLVNIDNYYFYQPKVFNDIRSPVYYKNKPIDKKTKFIEIDRLDLDDIYTNQNNNNNSNTNKDLNIINIFNNIKDNNTNFFELNNYKNIDELIIDYIITFLSCKMICQILKNILKKYLFKNISINDIEKLFLKRCDKYLLYYNKHIKLDKFKPPDKIIGYKIDNKYFCINYETKNIRECSNDVIDIIKFNEKLLKTKDTKISLNNIYGTTSLSKGNYILKIVDKTKEKDATTLGKTKSQRALVKGRACDNYNIKELKELTEKLKIKVPDNKIKKPLYCLYLSLFFLNNKKNGFWL